MIKILYVTGTRADYGLMYRTLMAIDANPSLTLEIAATGMHLMQRHGMTIDEIRDDGFVVHEMSDTFEADDRKAMARYVGATVLSLVTVMEEVAPDVILLLGDRGEMLAGAIAGAYMGIATAHIHGGDVSSTIDESARHAITKLAHIHYPATDESASRILKMGERPDTVHVVGSPGLVGIGDDLYDDPMIREKFNLSADAPYAILLQHPAEYDPETCAAQMRSTLQAIEELNFQTVVIYPNADAGGKAMIEVIESFDEPLFKVHAHITRKEFLSLMSHASVMVGNSSAGIIEAPSFALPVVNVGQRQDGRQRGVNIIDSQYGKDNVIRGIKKAMSDREFLENLRGSVNPYGDGKTDRRVARMLSELEINDELLQKKIAY